MYSESFPDRLKAARENAGYLQKEVQEKIGVNKISLSNYEQGRTKPAIETIEKLAALYHVSVEWLVGADAEKAIKTYQESFSGKLKTARKNAGYTQKEVTEKIGIKQNVLSSYEHGRREPNLEGLKKLVTLYNVSADWLLGIEQERKEKTYTMTNKIQEKRLELGWGRAEISRQLDIPIRTLEDWETEKRNPPIWAEKLILEKLDQKQKEENFKSIWKDAKEITDVDAFVSDWTLSSIWGDAEDAPIPEARIEGLQKLWQAAQDGEKDMPFAKAIFLNLF